MNTLPEDIQNTIYKYKHQMEFNHVVNEMHDIVSYWYDILADDIFEEHLCYDILAEDILAMIKVWNAI